MRVAHMEGTVYHGWCRNVVQQAGGWEPNIINSLGRGCGRVMGIMENQHGQTTYRIGLRSVTVPCRGIGHTPAGGMWARGSHARTLQPKGGRRNE